MPSSSPSGPALVWLRQDLRLADNPALDAAVRRGGGGALAFVLDDETPGPWKPGGASRWWLHHSLEALARDVAARGGGLILRRGRADLAIPQLAEELQAGAVYWNRSYEPYAVQRDTALKAQLKAAGLDVQSFNGRLLQEPWRLRTKTGEVFKVFSPYWRALRAMGPERMPLPAPGRLAGPAAASDPLERWGLLPTKPDWAGGLRATWRPGEAGAHARLAAFLEAAIGRYAEARNRPDGETTSRLSPHLHFGEISPIQAWAGAEAALAAAPQAAKGVDKFLSELAWREFSYNLLHHYPTLPDQPWRENFARFPHVRDDARIEAWRRGRTGYPIVDAGMRELWRTGWMHNRVRMITASFLLKDLLADWREGQAWFWDTLVDADLANNSASWQWVMGSGADAAPYFRVFNPVTQGETYDPQGAYVRRWAPELARLPDEVIHKPWEASAATLAAAGVKLGATYPRPIVDHAEARRRALEAFEAIR